jgi:hypothetical protein
VRDVGILIWVIFLVVGVLGSMVSSLRKASQRAAPQGQGLPGQPRVAQPQPAGAPMRQDRLPVWAEQIAAAVQRPAPPPARPAPPPRPAPRPAPPPPEHPAPQPAARARRIFGGRNELVRAVIAAEVLGKPRAFNDEYVGR